MKVFLVQGDAGSYSDAETWPVAVFSTREGAENWASRAGSAVEHHGAAETAWWERNGTLHHALREPRLADKSPWDSHYIRSDTQYSVVEMELDPTPPVAP